MVFPNRMGTEVPGKSPKHITNVYLNMLIYTCTFVLRLTQSGKVTNMILVENNSVY